MQVKFWGVRGSLPVANSNQQKLEHIKQVLSLFKGSPHFQSGNIDKFLNEIDARKTIGYGEATSCVEVRNPDNKLENLVIDGGSALKIYNDFLSQNRRDQTKHHIVMTHFHYDHIMGLPFFAPHFIAGHEIHYYSVQPECEAVVRGLFAKPIFPVAYENLSAKIFFHQIHPYQTQVINGFSITPYKMDHPDPCFGFRIEKNGKVYSHAVDHESVRITPDELGKDVEIFKNADLLFFDAQYTEAEMSERAGWGHGTFTRAFEVCSLYKVKRVVLAHHDPSYGTLQMQRLESKAREEFETCKKEKNISDLIWSFGCDGEEINL